MLSTIKATLVLLLARPAMSNSAADENRGAFEALCSLVNLAKHPAKTLEAPADIASTLETIAAINMTVADTSFLDKVDVSKEWRSADQPFRDARPGWDKHYDLFAKAKKKATGQERAAFEKWAAAKGVKAIQKQVIQIADAAKAIADDADAEKTKLGTSELTNILNRALYGTETENGDTYKLATSRTDDRAKLCSQKGGKGTAIPGKSLVYDLICLCARGPNSDGSAGNACCSSCAGGLSTEVHVDTDAKAHVNALLAACGRLNTQTELTPTALNAAVATLATKLTHKTSTQTNENNVLGSINSDGSAGCTGNAAANGGKCVVYKAGLTTSGESAVQWLVQLQEAVDEEAKRHEANQKLQTLATQIKLLNITLAALEHGATAQAHVTAADKHKTADSTDKEKECNKAKDDKEKCNELKEQGCVFNETGEPNTKCQFNGTKASKNGVPVTQAQTAGTETTTDKCKGKKQKDCKSPDCKWEDETCKDSSILVNKQFALSVVSAAFVALLF
uniref:Variable surface glycoprotein n=1 Tax=Trypanosoma evansi TaxID=5697 RepID=Q6QA67_TRYEV|nr:variable surface glycoprotein [Trypanosoma evansi]